VVADAAVTDGATSVVVRRCASIGAANVESERVSPMACDLVLVTLIRVGTQAMVGLWSAVSSVEISCLAGDPHPRVTAIATLVAMLGLTSSGMMTEKACDQCGTDGYGTDGYGTDESNMESVREERGAGLEYEVDWCSLVQPARLLLPVD